MRQKFSLLRPARRHSVSFFSAFFAVGVSCYALCTRSASAQVTANETALDRLPAAHKETPAKKKNTSAAHTASGHKKPVKHKAEEKPASRHEASGTTPTAAPAAAPRRAPPAATIPAAPPPVPVLTPPPVPVELHPFPMPADPKAVGDAKGNATPISGGIRLIFGTDSSDLNPEMRAAVLAFVQVLKNRPDTRAIVDACGSGAPNDPSRPRRKALARGLVVRAVLMNAGIPSTRIYVRVTGAPDEEFSNVSDDRVDLRRSDAIP